MLPLVSAITPTYNRRAFLPRAVRCFQYQTYPNIEWVILDNGTDPIKDLLPNDPRIKYHRIEGEQLSHGALMNKGFELAQGEFCIVLDDDDVYPPNRITRQINPLIEDPTKVVSGTSTLYYYIHGGEQAYRYECRTPACWVGAFAVRRSEWEKHKFEDCKGGADFKFLQLIPRHQWVDLKDPELIVASIHPNNACPKYVNHFKPADWSTVKGLLSQCEF